MNTLQCVNYFEDLPHPIGVREDSQTPRVGLTERGSGIQVPSIGKRGDERSSIQRCASGMVVKPNCR